MHLRLRATRLLLLSVVFSLLGNGVAFTKSKRSAKSGRTESVSGYTTKKGKHVRPIDVFPPELRTRKRNGQSDRLGPS